MFFKNNILTHKVIATAICCKAYKQNHKSHNKCCIFSWINNIKVSASTILKTFTGYRERYFFVSNAAWGYGVTTENLTNIFNSKILIWNIHNVFKCLTYCWFAKDSFWFKKCNSSEWLRGHNWIQFAIGYSVLLLWIQTLLS